MNKLENIIGFVGIIVALLLGKLFLATDVLFLKLIVGIALGYALSRAYTGFAGSINRAYNTGSTKLMRTMMFMFFITAMVTSALVVFTGAENYNLWIKPINLGLIIGAILFGFGMSFSSCCASGVLTDLLAGLPRAFSTLIFFSIGVFLGYPLQRTASWVRRSWFSTPTGINSSDGGVFLPDLFKNDGLNGYIGAIIMVGVLCLIVTAIAYGYERKRKLNGTYSGVPAEKLQHTVVDYEKDNPKFFSVATYNKFVVSPWTLTQGAIALTAIFIVMMGAFRYGWAASSPYGLWFGKVLMVFGVSADSLANFTKMDPSAYTTPFFQDPTSVQDFGIIIGTAFYFLSAGIFKKMFFSEMHITFKQFLLYALGGLTMGFGTRLANGCNVGALYSPISNLSLSGWFFLVFMVVGGIIGNTLAKRLNS